MKKQTILSSLILSIGLLLGCNDEVEKESQQTLSPSEMPGSVKIKMEDEDKFKAARKAWIESMHPTSGNIDWELMNKRHRQRKQLKYINNKSDINLVSYYKVPKSLPSATPLPAVSEEIIDDPLAEMAADAGINGYWIEKGSKNTAGRIRSADYYTPADSIYTVSDGGNVWKGSINGNDWTVLNDQIRFIGPTTLHAIEVNNKPRIIVTSRSYTSYSDDDGATWNISTGLDNPTQSGEHFHSVITNDNTLYLMVQERVNNISVTSVYRSTDLGVSFQKIWDRPGVAQQLDIWVDKFDVNNELYMLDGNEFHKWNGSDFVFVGSMDFNMHPILTTNLNNVYIAKNGDDVYVGANSNNGSEITYIYKSENDGINWSYKGFVLDKPWAKRSISVVREVDGKLLFGGAHFYISLDDGEEWTMTHNLFDYFSNPLKNMHGDVTEVRSFDKNGEEFFIISTDGGNYVTYDHTEDITNISMQNHNVSQYYSTYTIPNKPNVMWAGSQDQSVQRTLEADIQNALDFNIIGTGDIGQLTSSDEGNSLWVVSGGCCVWRYWGIDEENAPYYTQVNWLNYGSDINRHGTQVGMEIDGQQLWMPPLYPHPYDANSVLFGGGGQNGEVRLYRLTGNPNDRNSDIRILFEELPYNFRDGDVGSNIAAIAVSPIDKDKWFVMKNNGKLFKSTDAGVNWVKLPSTGLGGHGLYGSRILPDPFDEDKLYIAGSGFTGPGVMISTDDGQSFQPLDNGLPNTLVIDIEMDATAEHLVAATEVGAYIMPLSGNEWYDLGGPEQVYWSLEYIESENMFRFGTYGRGIWDFYLTEDTTQYYHIVNKGTGLRLHNCSTTDNTPITGVSSSDESDCTQWEMVENGSHFHLRNKAADKYIRPTGTGNGLPVVVQPTSWTGNWTQWSYNETGDGYGHLVNRSSGKHVYSTAAGAIEHQPSGWTGDWTRWEFVPVVNVGTSSSSQTSSSSTVSSSSVVSSSSQLSSSSSTTGNGVTGTEYDACVYADGSVDVGVPGKSNDGDFFGGYLNNNWFWRAQTAGACANGVCNIPTLGASVGDSFQYFCQGGGCDTDSFYPGTTNQPGALLTLRSCE